MSTICQIVRLLNDLKTVALRFDFDANTNMVLDHDSKCNMRARGANMLSSLRDIFGDIEIRYSFTYAPII
jgi:hypothetical protein